MKTLSSLGAKLALVCIVCVCVVAAIAAGFSVLQIRMLKEQMLRGSVRLAEEKARLLADELSALERDAAAIDDETHRRALQEKINLFIKRNDEVVLAGIIEIGQQGIKRVLVSDSRGPRSQLPIAGRGNAFQAELREGDQDALKVILQPSADMPVSLTPLKGGESSGLHLALAVRDSESFRQIESAGRMITRRVAVMAGMLSGSLILAFVGVWILFNGQERLIRENEQLNKMAYVGTLAGGLAHEIRNPLNAMNVHLGIVKEDLEDPQEDSAQRVRQIVERLSREVEQLNQTVVNFLAFAIPREAGRERVNPIRILQETLANMEEEIHSRAVLVDQDLKDGVEIEGDPEGLRQVFQNLLVNALESMTGTERILRLTSAAEGNRLRIEISDTGEGIQPEDLEKIFEPFQTSKGRGTGFGLPIARRIVCDHRGKIWATSTPGSGATFCLVFPLPSSKNQG